MSAAHTPGLLSLSKAKHMGGEYVVATLAGDRGDRSLVIHAPKGDDTQADENARRLVACWNSFDGIETELIESVEGLGKATLPYRILQARSKALLVAAEAMLQEITGCMATTETTLRKAIEVFKAERTEL